MSRDTRRFFLTCALIVAVLLFLLSAVRVARAEPERYVPASRSTRTAVLTRAQVLEAATETSGATRAASWVRVAFCESSWNMRATANRPYVGLLQVDPVLHRAKVARVLGFAVTPAESVDYLKNPYVNLLVADLILAEQGWGAWPYCGRFR